MPRAHDQRAPRQGTIADVRTDDVPQTPALQVRDLDMFGQLDARSARAQPVAELDVFDAWPRVTSIEASNRQKRRSSDRTAARPERRSCLMPALVHKVVQEV